MAKRKPLTDEEGEVRELDAEDFKAMRPAREVLDPELYANLVRESERRRVGQRGPGKRPRKVPIAFRLDSDLVDAIRATGDGYGTRVNKALRGAFLKKARAEAVTKKTGRIAKRVSSRRGVR